MPQKTIAIAPMLDWTDRHCRYLFRLLSKHIVLYTEMVTTGAILFGNRDQHLAYHEIEHPVALQLGGSDPKALAECAKIAENYGYDEINLNVGCPSDRVQNGRFGACLMAEPKLVAHCIDAMKNALNSPIPVTIKTRIGIDDKDSYEELQHFVATTAQAGCETFIIHARKAWLSGLSPKENREIPPLRYDIAKQLASDFPKLTIILNGGITDLDQVENHLKNFAGVMLGRAAYHDPYLLSSIDQRFYGSPEPISTHLEIVEKYLPYMEHQLSLWTPLSHMARHLLNLFHGQDGAKAWRRHLSENMHLPQAGINVIIAGLKNFIFP